jgi:hypothetical protein
MLNGIRVPRLIAITSAAVLGVAMLIGVSSPLQAAGMAENKAIVNFDRPVEVPGKVLPPGSYVFKTLDNNELVQVFSADERQLFATVNVVPEDRPAQEANIDCFVQMNKTRADAPQEVEAFFLPGRSTGYQFVYPTAHAARHHQ